METKRLEALTEDRSVADPIWVHIRSEAADILSSDADLVRLVRSNILDQPSFDRAVIERLAARLDHPDVPRAVIMEIFASIAQSDPSIGEGFRADLMAVADRDPACTRFVEPLLYFKGYHALQTHRFAYALARQGPERFCALFAKPVIGNFPNRYQSGCTHWPRCLSRSRNRSCCRPDRCD